MDRRRRNRILSHLLVWGAAAALYLALAHPLARALALDFQALLENVSQDYSPSRGVEWYAHRAWIPYGKALILLGAAPMFLLAAASVIYWLLPWRVVVANPLQGARRGWRLAAGLGSFLVFAAACLPAALGLSVWIQVEAYCWIQWYDKVDEVLEQIREVAPLSMLPGMILAGAWCAWRSTRRPRATRRPLWARLLLAGCMLLTLPLLAPLAGALAVGAVHASRLAAAPGPGVFEDKCAGCHDLTLPLYYVKTPVEWERTVQTQVKEEEVKLSPAQREQVLGFLVGMRSFSDSWTFRTRCQRCHPSTSGWSDRSPADWSAVVARLARWSPYYFRPDVQAQLVGHLTRTRSRPGATLGLDRAAYEASWELARICSRCHSLSRGMADHRKAEEARLARLFSRMNNKLARPLSQQKLQRLRAPYRRLLADADLLKRLFPHDRPAEDGWITW